MEYIIQPICFAGFKEVQWIQWILQPTLCPIFKYILACNASESSICQWGRHPWTQVGLWCASQVHLQELNTCCMSRATGVLRWCKTTPKKVYFLHFMWKFLLHAAVDCLGLGLGKPYLIQLSCSNKTIYNRFQAFIQTMYWIKIKINFGSSAMS